METELVPQSTGEFSFFGSKVEVTDRYAFVMGSAAIGVQVYAYDGSEWAPSQTLLPAMTMSAGFTGAMAAYGDVLTVAATGDVDAGDPDRVVEIFTLQGDEWVPSGRLFPNASREGFGASVDTDGQQILVGAPNWGTSPSMPFMGKAYLFALEEGEWLLEAELSPSPDIRDRGTAFSLAIDGNTAVVSATGENHSGYSGAGAVYVFEREAGVWSQSARLVPEVPGAWESFGKSVSLEGNRLVVGSDGGNLNPASGVAYLFVREEEEGWKLMESLIPPDATEDMRFGTSISLTNEVVAVASMANGYTFSFTTPAPSAMDAEWSGTSTVDIPITLSGIVYDDSIPAFEIVRPPNHGDLLGTGAERNYRPADGFEGEDLFRFVVRDARGFISNTATVTVYVTAAAPADDLSPQPRFERPGGCGCASAGNAGGGSVFLALCLLCLGLVPQRQRFVAITRARAAS